jgi:hypothetical protein
VVGLPTASSSALPTFEVSLPSGIRVGVASGFAVEDLRQLLAVLEER